MLSWLSCRVSVPAIPSLMKRHLPSLLFCLIYFGGLLANPCWAIVYVNRVLSPTPSNPCNYGLATHIVQGNEVWDANYQNAYGTCAGLQPGPPFILESQLQVIEGDLTVQGGVMQVNWTIIVDSSNVLRLNNVDFQVAAGVNVNISSRGVIEGNGTNFSFIGSNTIAVNFGGIGVFNQCTFQTAGRGLIDAFVPDSLVIDQCTFNSSGTVNGGQYHIRVTGNFNPIDFILTNSQFNTTAQTQSYVQVITTPNVVINDNTFGPTVGLGVSTGSVPSLEMNDNHFQGILCPGAVSASCGPVLLNDTGVRTVRGNTGTGSTFNGIRMAFAGAIRPDGTGRIRSEPGFPFVLNTALIVSPQDSLIIEPGTIFKVGSSDNMQIRGHLIADHVVFTSERDTTIDGNTTRLFNPDPGDWNGIGIDGQGSFTASGRFTNCTFKYGGDIAYTIRRNPNSHLVVDSCRFEWCDGNVIQLLDASATEPNTFARITNSEFYYNQTGIAESQRYPTNPTLIKNNRFVGNELGIHLWSATNYPIIDGNFMAGNRLDGLRFRGGSGLMVNNIMTANGQDGIFHESNPVGDSLRVLNNHLVGNRRHGITVINGTPNLIATSNNLLAYNFGYGVSEASIFTGDNPYRHNAFWSNGSGNFWDDNSTLLDIPSLNQEPNSALNVLVNPELVLLDSGVVASNQVVNARFETRLMIQGGGLTPDAWREKLLWNRNNGQFYLVLRNTADQVTLADTLPQVTAGTAFWVVDIEQLSQPSPLADLGEILSYLPTEDYFQQARIQQATVDIGAMESNDQVDFCQGDTILYVDLAATGAETGLTWNDALTDLQAAFDLVSSGACTSIREIWVKEGTYRPDPVDRWQAFEWPAGVKVFGSFPANMTSPGKNDRNWPSQPTILSGEIGSPTNEQDNSVVLVLMDSLAGTAHLDGFMIASSNSWDAGDFQDDPSGMLIEHSADLKVCMRNVWLTGHKGGAGAALGTRGSSALELEVFNSRFSENFSNFSGGVMHLAPEGAEGEVRARFTNCIFDQNIAQDSGGVVYTRILDSATVIRDFIHCTFYDNRASLDAGLDYAKSFNGATLETEYENCIIHRVSSTAGTPVARYQGDASLRLAFTFLNLPDCDSLAVSPNQLQCLGFMNYGGSPAFIDSSTYDLRLAEGSPCIGTADEYASLFGLDTDYDYQPRVVDGNADQGAYEFQGTTHLQTRNSAQDWTIFPNPTSSELNLQIKASLKPNATLRLYDQQGRQIWVQPYKAQIRLGPLPPGQYWLTLQNGQERSAQAVQVLP